MIIEGKVEQVTTLHLHKTLTTLLVFSLQLHPVFHHHLEFLENQVVSETISSRGILYEVVFMRRELFDGTVDCDSCPE